MKTLIISDTHGSLPAVERVFKLAGPVDQVLHAGDVLYHGPRNPLPNGYTPKDLADFLARLDMVTYVRGNCDSAVDRMVLGGVDMPDERIITIDGVQIYMAHGDILNDEDRIFRAKALGASVAISGHTHVAVLKREDDMVLLNPGSTTLPKDNAASFAILENGWFILRNAENGREKATLKLS